MFYPTELLVAQTLNACVHRTESQVRVARHRLEFLLCKHSKNKTEQRGKCKNKQKQLHLQRKVQGWPRQTKPKKGRFMNFSQGHSGTKFQCESCLFSQGKTPEFTKIGEIHELFVLALFLVWFAGATPEKHYITHQKQFKTCFFWRKVIGLNSENKFWHKFDVI